MLNKVWYKIQKADRKGYLMVTSTEGEDEREAEREDGLYAGHAYSLVGCAEVMGSDKKKHRIVQIRNPWGSGDWNGDFSDDSSLWTPQAKAQVNFTHGNDGIFWMTVEDYCQSFVSLGICKANPNYYFNYVQLKATMTDINEHQAVLIEVSTAGKYYFSVDQDDSRLHDENFENASVRITIAKVEQNGFKWVSCAYSQDRNTSVKCKINPGKYIAIFELSSESEGVRNISFSSYGANIPGL